MKVSMNQLQMVISKMKYSMLGYSRDEEDLEVEITLTKEDPGNGVMVDCLTLTTVKPSGDEEDQKETRMSVEVYPASEKLDPIASKTESFRVKGKY